MNLQNTLEESTVGKRGPQPKPEDQLKHSRTIRVHNHVWEWMKESCGGAVNMIETVYNNEELKLQVQSLCETESLHLQNKNSVPTELNTDPKDRWNFKMQDFKKPIPSKLEEYGVLGDVEVQMAYGLKAIKRQLEMNTNITFEDLSTDTQSLIISIIEEFYNGPQ